MTALPRLLNGRTGKPPVPLYDLPLWALDVERFPDDGIYGQGWRVGAKTIAIPPFSEEAAFYAHLSSMRERYPQYAVTYIFDPKTENQSRAAPQVYVEARSRMTAQRVFDLIRASLMLIDGGPTFFIEDQIALPQNLNYLEDLKREDLFNAGRNTLARFDVLLATRITSKLSRNRHRQYSAYKLQLSLLTCAVDYMELRPNYRRKELYVRQHPYDHVRMSTATTLAYSAIEEMQLEPRSIAKRPVKLPDGSWEPSALADLNSRLKKAGIDVSTSVVWNVRGSPTRIEKSARAPRGTKQSWSKGIVRDKAVTIQDALVAASWMRSRCTTHRYPVETKSISMLDVHNVQFLARRLLLESLGLWKAFGAPDDED